MKYILYINALVELLGGLILIMNPTLLLLNSDPEPQGIIVSKLYGILAFAFGLMSLILAKHFEFTKLFKQVILTVIGFHFAVGLFMYGVYSQGLTPSIVASVLHLSLAIGLGVMYARENQKFETENEPT